MSSPAWVNHSLHAYARGHSANPPVARTPKHIGLWPVRFGVLATPKGGLMDAIVYLAVVLAGLGLSYPVINYRRACEWKAVRGKAAISGRR